jgi:hypothetical protein
MLKYKISGTAFASNSIIYKLLETIKLILNYNKNNITSLINILQEILI